MLKYTDLFESTFKIYSEIYRNNWKSTENNTTKYTNVQNVSLRTPTPSMAHYCSLCKFLFSEQYGVVLAGLCILVLNVNFIGTTNVDLVITQRNDLLFKCNNIFSLMKTCSKVVLCICIQADLTYSVKHLFQCWWILSAIYNTNASDILHSYNTISSKCAWTIKSLNNNIDFLEDNTDTIMIIFIICSL